MKDKGIILARGSFSYNMFYWLAIFIIYFLKPSPLYSQFINTESNKFDNVGDISEFSQELVSVFLDCSSCDNSYIRQQINFVNYVRNVQLARIHVFITKHATVSGGQIFTILDIPPQSLPLFRAKVYHWFLSIVYQNNQG